MDQNEILRRVDHTILTPTATWEQVKTVCDEGKQFGVASVCIPPRYVKRANGYVGGGLKICTVIGFPNGYATPETKVFETEDAIRDGADEIDVTRGTSGRILKVIVEACNFTEEEKISLCRVVSMSGAEFIKTSTGFASGGATAEDVRLFREHISPDMRVKAAGGIRTFEQAQAMLDAGADRIGASALVALMK